MKKILILVIVIVGFLSAEMPKWQKWQNKRSGELTGVDQELFISVAFRHCYSPCIKELIGRGADKNLVMNMHGGKLMAYLNEPGIGSQTTEALLRWLSSIGADSYGLIHTRSFIYSKPKVFENKHIKMIIADVTLGGGADDVIFENKTDEPIYITKQITKSNGYISNAKFKTPKLIEPNDIKKATFFDFFFDLPPNEAYEKAPKIINNRVKFERQLTLVYKYKNKEYMLKTPVMQEDFEVPYYNGKTKDGRDDFW